MAQAAWEKTDIQETTSMPNGSERWKFLVGGGLILAFLLHDLAG